MVSFYCTTKSISYTYTYIPSVWISFPFRPPQSTEWTSLSIHWVRIKFIYFMLSISSVCMSVPISQFIPAPCVHMFVMYVMSISVLQKKIIYIISLDSTPILNILSFPGFVNQTLFKRERFQGFWIQTTDDHSNLTGDKISYLRQVHHPHVDTSSPSTAHSSYLRYLAHLC